MIEYKASLGGCECAIAEWNPDGSILVFALHGWLDNLASFENLVEYMPEVRLIALDFPGHGHSQHIPPGQSYHFMDGLYLIDDLRRHFDQDTINILGHSMGAAVATLYAASQVDKVSKVVLIESLGPLTAEPDLAIELMTKAVNQRVMALDKRKPVYPKFELALRARAEASQISEQLIKPLVERALNGIQGGYTWRADSRLRLASPLRMSEAQLLRVLLEIKAPVLLIEGESGFLVKDSIMQRRKNNFKDLQQQLLAGGHHVHLEQPQACARLIETFFMDKGEL